MKNLTPARAPRIDRCAPHDIAAEESVLASCLAFMDAPAIAVEALKPEHFYSPVNQLRFQVIGELYAEGGRVDPIAVADRLERQMIERTKEAQELTRLQLTGPSLALLAPHAKIVRRMADRRRLIEVCSAAMTAAYHDDECGLMHAHDAILRHRDRLHDTSSRSIGDAWKRLRDGHHGVRPRTVLARSDGHGLIDAGAMVLVFGRGGVGKTSVALLAAFPEVSRPRRVAWCDLDNMGEDQLVERLARMGRTPLEVTDDNFRYLSSDSADTFGLLLRKAASFDPDVVVIDSLIGALTLAGVDSENDNVRVRSVLQTIRDQLNRRPTTIIVIDHGGHESGRARGASAKAQAADQVIEVTAIEPTGIGLQGRLRLTSHKDRRGHWPDGSIVAEVLVDASEQVSGEFAHLGTRMSMTLDAPTSCAHPSVQWKSLILEALKGAGGGAPWAVIRKSPTLSSASNQDLAAVKNELVREGKVKVTQLRGRAFHLSLVTSCDDAKPS